jgi:hypothetical protein
LSIIERNRQEGLSSVGGDRKTSFVEYDISTSSPQSSHTQNEMLLGNDTKKCGDHIEDSLTSPMIKDTNIDCGMFSLSTSRSFLLDPGANGEANFQESKLVSGQDCNRSPRSQCTNDILLPSTTWSGFVAKKRSDAIHHCKSVLEVHDRTHKTIRAAVQMISDNLSPIRNRANDDDCSSPNNDTNSPVNQKLTKQRILPEENDAFLSNFMYCPKPLNIDMTKQDQNDEQKIGGEGDAIILSRHSTNQHETNERPSSYPCGSGLYEMDDFRQDYCCGASDNYDTLLYSLRKQQPVNTDRSQSMHFDSERPSSLHIVGTNNINVTNCANSQQSPFVRFERSLPDPESWVGAATEKIDSIIYQLMGGNNRQGSNRRRCTNSTEVGPRHFVFQAPLLKKSVAPSPKC